MTIHESSNGIRLQIQPFCANIPPPAHIPSIQRILSIKENKFS